MIFVTYSKHSLNSDAVFWQVKNMQDIVYKTGDWSVQYGDMVFLEKV